MTLNRLSALVALMALGATAIPADAQTTRNDAWQIAVQLPSATAAALRGGDGISWDQFRRNGLALSARGSGEVSLVMFGLTVENGRVVDSWTSRPFDAAAGTGQVSGRSLPAAQTVRVARVTHATAADRPVPVDALIEASKSGRIDTKTLPSDMTRGRILVMFATPAGGGFGSSTSPLFVRTEELID